MYILLVYDVGEKRVAKYHKYLKRYLNWVQNSVFEGELTESQIESVKAGLEKIMVTEKDSVIIYTGRESRWLTRQVLGKVRADIDNLL